MSKRIINGNSYYGGICKLDIPIDKYIDEYVFKGKKEGFFIELGAHNGEFFSNTLFLEESRGWNGVLIEPSPKFFDCEKRRKVKCFHCACINDENITSLEGKFIGSPMDALNISKARPKGKNIVNMRTLSSILKECNYQGKIDFMSLDVEGVEIEVLEGMNSYRPEYILIETFGMSANQLNQWMTEHGYTFVDIITDFNNPKKHPRWDGTHQDFLWHYEPDLIEKIKGPLNVFKIF